MQYAPNNRDLVYAERMGRTSTKKILQRDNFHSSHEGSF